MQCNVFPAFFICTCPHREISSKAACGQRRRVGEEIPHLLDYAHARIGKLAAKLHAGSAGE